MRPVSHVSSGTEGTDLFGVWCWQDSTAEMVMVLVGTLWLYCPYVVMRALAWSP